MDQDTIPPQLTQKQEDFADALAKQTVFLGTTDHEAAALAAGYSKTSAQHMGKTMKNEQVRERYLQKLEEYGVNQESTAKVMEEGLNAERVIVVNAKEGWTERVPDYATRLRVVQEYHKIKGVYAQQTHQIEKRVAHFHLFADKSVEELEALNGQVIEEVV